VNKGVKKKLKILIFVRNYHRFWLKIGGNLTYINMENAGVVENQPAFGYV